MSTSSFDDSFDALLNPQDWRNEVDDDERMAMIEPILAIMAEDLKHMSEHETLTIVTNIEMALFQTSFSKEEYQDAATVQRRMDAFVLFGRTVAMSDSSAEIADTTSSLTVVTLPIKRQRIEPAEFLLNNQVGLVKHVYSFVDGVEIFRHLRINRFTANNLKHCIQRIDLCCNILRASSQPSNLLLSILQGTPQLKRLQIEENDSSLTHDEAALLGNARIIRQLAQALDQGMVNKLVILHVDLKFTYKSFTSDGNTHELLEAFSKGHHSKLISLRLSRFLTQDMVVGLAKLVAQDKLPSLMALTLCGNGIGERGARALWLALASPSTDLVILNLPGNILTDRDVQRLAKVLEESDKDMKRLSIIDLRDNFFTREGRAALENVSEQERYSNIKLMLD